MLHRGKSRPAPELVTKTMAILERANDVTERQMEEVSKNISAMKSTMFSAGESDTAREAATVLAYEVRTPLWLASSRDHRRLPTGRRGLIL